MSKTLNEMVRAIVDYCGSITRAADEIGVHYNTLDRLLKDESATAHAGTAAKIEALYEEIEVEEELEEVDEPQEKITKLEMGKAYEIKVPKNKNGNVVILLQGTVKKEYRQFYQLDNDGKSVTVLKADLINDRTVVRELDAPAEEVKEPVDVEYVPSVDDEPDETTKMIEELMEEPAEEEESTPTIIGTTPAERLHSCLFLVEQCDQKIAEAEKAKKDRAAILPMMDQIYKEFRGGDIDGSND